MGNRGDHLLDNMKPGAPPGLEFLFRADFVLADLSDIGPLAAGRRLVVPIEAGGRIEGPRMRGQHLPGSMLIQLVRSDGIMEFQSNVVAEMDDDHRIFFRTDGIFWISDEAVRELAEGRSYDPASLYARSFVRFEAAEDGPYAWLNRGLYIASAIRSADHVTSTVWKIL